MADLGTSAWITTAVLAGLVVLFATERFRPDVLAVLGLVVLAGSGIVDVTTALTGFAHPAVVTVVAFFVLSSAVSDAGIPQAIARGLFRVTGSSQSALTLLTMSTVGAMSAFMNNIAASLILLPAVNRLARTAKISALKLMMPLSFGSLLGGLATLVGTPPNIIAADLLAESGAGQLRMFDFAPTGLAAMATGMIYFLLVGRRLLPDRPAQGEIARVEQARDFLFELRVTGEFDDPGANLMELGWRGRYNVSVLEIRRGKQRLRTVSAREQVFIGDRLIISGEYDDVMRLAHTDGIEHARPAEGQLESGANTVVTEMVATPWFESNPNTLTDYAFGARYGGQVLGIWRHGRRLTTDLARTRIRTGDVLLIQLPRDGLGALAADNHFLLMRQRTDHLEKVNPSALRALAVLVGVIAVAATGLTHIAIAVLGGILALLALRVISAQRLYEAIDWRLPVLIGAMIPIGGAMQTTGVASAVADQLANLAAGSGDYALLVIVFLTTALLTQAVANPAAVVIMAPIALALVTPELGVSATGLMVTVAVSASTAFITPFGHQANLLVYNAGGYRYLEFTRVGLPLTLLVMVVTVLMVQWVWPA